ncbi:hypothetical protein GCM10028825_21990 [Spirosoma agri]
MFGNCIHRGHFFEWDHKIINLINWNATGLLDDHSIFFQKKLEFDSMSRKVIEKSRSIDRVSG